MLDIRVAKRKHQSDVKRGRFSYEVASLRADFDAEFYLSTYPDIANAKRLDPVAHFCRYGWKEHRDPTPNFSTSYYLRTNSDVRDAKINPFLHYIKHGKAEGRASSALDSITTNVSGLEQEAGLIRNLFDHQFYLTNHPDVAEVENLDPVLHYCTYGWKEFRDPTPDFSTSYYLEANPDIRLAGVNPFWHYVSIGKLEGRLPVAAKAPDDPTTAADKQRQYEISKIHHFFDVDYYLQSNPDLGLDAKSDPLLHYLETGWKEGRDPSKGFSTSHYLDANPDVRAANINPFLHYVTSGQKEGRAPVSVTQDIQKSAAQDARLSSEIALLQDAFDIEFYETSYPELLESPAFEPLEHYCQKGWKQGLDPTNDFSTSFYLDANPDVKEAGVNPFLHFVTAGKKEGRQSGPNDSHHIVIALSKTKPLDQTARAWACKPQPKSLLDQNQLIAIISTACESGSKKLMLSISHDNYRKTAGGVQFCIQREEVKANERGLAYLNLSPYTPQPCLAKPDETSEFFITVVLDGTTHGVAQISAVIAALKENSNTTETVEAVIHHLMGHQPEEITNLIKATGLDQCKIWVHDFFTLCPSYALQRNNVSFCGAPKSNSNACALCLYGEERLSHQNRMTAFFDALNVDVIAPSQFSADFWSHKASLKHTKLSIRDHLTVEFVAKAKADPVSQGPITIAFVGYPGLHKGWPVFERLVKTTAHDTKKFRFLYFGIADVKLRNVENININVTAENPSAMIDSLAEENVDFVFHWASCAETFSFSTHEAFAAGAYVLTNPHSGNVAAAVNRLNCGVVLEDQSELQAFITDGLAETMTRKIRQQRAERTVVLSHSDMTFSVSDQE